MAESSENPQPPENNFQGLMDRLQVFNEHTGIKIFRGVMADIPVGMLEGKLEPLEAVKILGEISKLCQGRWSLTGEGLGMEARTRAYSVARDSLDKKA